MCATAAGRRRRRVSQPGAHPAPRRRRAVELRLPIAKGDRPPVGGIQVDPQGDRLDVGVGLAQAPDRRSDARPTFSPARCRTWPAENRSPKRGKRRTQIRVRLTTHTAIAASPASSTSA